MALLALNPCQLGMQSSQSVNPCSVVVNKIFVFAIGVWTAVTIDFSAELHRSCDTLSKNFSRAVIRKIES
jgi:hypothetical protein